MITTRRTKSDWSTHLGEHDHQVLEAHLNEEQSVSLVTCLAEVVLTLPNNQNRWHKMGTGVLCFVKDYSFRTYYFRLFSLDFCIEASAKPELLWEQQLSFPFNYNKVTSKFHFFGTDFGYAGFNFMYEDEAKKALKVITEKIKVKKFKTLRKQQDSAVRILPPNPPPSFSPSPASTSVTQLSEPEASRSIGSSTPLRKLKRTLSNSSVVNYLKSKIVGTGKQKAGEKRTVKKLEIGEPTEPRLVKHVGASSNSVYEKRFRDILVELNLSFQERSFSASQCGGESDELSSSRKDDSFEDLNSSGMIKLPGAVRRFAPPPPPKPADPNELTAFLGKKASQAPFPSPLTPPISPESGAEAKTRETTRRDETLSHCSLSPIEKNACLVQIPVTPSDELAIGEVKENHHRSALSPPAAARKNDNGDDFNSKIGFKGFTNKVHMTPRLKAVYDASFVSPTFTTPATATTDSSQPAPKDAEEDVFLFGELRAEVLRQAPYLATCSDED